MFSVIAGFSVMAGLVPAIHVLLFDGASKKQARRGCPAQGRA
jgi:hypothetical protein